MKSHVVVRIDEFEGEDFVLEVTCPVCHARVRKDCKTCHGHGIIPTQLGVSLLAFVMRNAKRWKAGEFAQLGGKPTE